MPRWEVRARDRVVRKDATNWLVALGLAIDELGLDASLLTHMACEPGPERSLVLADPVTGLSFVVRPASEARAAWDEPSASRGAARLSMADGGHATGAISQAHEDEEHLFGDLDDLEQEPLDEPSTMPRPALDMPAPAARTPEEPDTFSLFPRGGADPARMPPDVAMRLLERGLEIAMAPSSEAAADQAITVLRQIVAADGGAVLVIRGGGLAFLAAQGPQAERVRGTTIPRDAGFAGFVVHQGTPLLVPNAAADIRHHSELDTRTGYRTRAVLAVPIRDGKNVVHGCLQLVNPPTRFLPWHLEAASSVAVALAESLRSRK